jgi:hypothetical protein
VVPSSSTLFLCHLAVAFILLALSLTMANGQATKRPREEEDSEPGEFETSASDGMLVLSDDDNDSHANFKKKVKIEKEATIRDTAIRKLRSAPKGSIGIPAVRALLAQSGSSSTKFMDAAKETNSGFRKTGRVAKADPGTQKNSNAKGKTKGKESAV